MEIYNERVGDGPEDLILVADVVDLLGLDEFDFFHNLGTGVLAVLLALNELDAPEGTLIKKGVPSPRVLRNS